MENKKVIKKFVEERNRALLSLDKKKILAFMAKFGVQVMPTDETVFWGGVHKAILNINAATEQQKSQSRTWLKQNGFCRT